MVQASDGKWRALRIPLSSHKHDKLQRTRIVLSVIAVGVVIGWLLFGLFQPDQGTSRYSPGPVSSAHAHLNCNQCHADSAPMRDDSKCRDCHPEATTQVSMKTVVDEFEHETMQRPLPVFAHSENEKLDAVGNCASCHREHLGLEVSPIEVVDIECLHCHQNLKPFVDEGHESKIENKITRFYDEHPDFRSLEKDPGTLKFNHQLHMSAGLRQTDARQSLKKTLNNYNEHRDMLTGYTTPCGVIALRCDFCHQPLPAGSVSRAYNYMSMPTYEQNCKLCHSINLTANENSNFALGTTLSIEHGISSKKILDHLQVYFALEVIAPEDVKTNLGDNDRLIPELPIDLWRIGQAAHPSDANRIEKNIQSAEMQIRNKCLRCHLTDAQKKVDSLIPDVAIMKGEDATGTMSNPIWLKHAKFSHFEHRDMLCKECHADVETNQGIQPSAPNTVEKPMIANRANCIRCHQPANDVVDSFRPGPYNCIACHTYHGGGNRMYRIMSGRKN